MAVVERVRQTNGDGYTRAPGRELYPFHEEDRVPVTGFHERQVRYLRDVLETRLKEWHVTGDLCMYWMENATNLYRAPDVLVMKRRPPVLEEEVYCAWEDGPAPLVIEIGSKSTLKEDEGPKIERYLLDLDVQEYLYYRRNKNPRRRQLRMWRLESRDAKDEVVEVEPDRHGRVRSAVGLEFGVDAEGYLRVFELDGTPLPTLADYGQQLEQERQRNQELQQELDRLRTALSQQNSGA